jgi:hypothetical protein
MTNPNKTGEHSAKCRFRIRDEVLNYYSNGKYICATCGFSDIRALSIDHINGDGKNYRGMSHRSGTGLYYWLKRNHYPKGYQILCMNCQSIKKSTNKECNNQYNYSKHNQTIKHNQINNPEVLDMFSLLSR